MLIIEYWSKIDFMIKVKLEDSIFLHVFYESMIFELGFSWNHERIWPLRVSS